MLKIMESLMPNTRVPFDASTPKRAANVSLDSDLPEQIAELREKRWLEENREALKSSNAYIEAHGLPLAKHRPY